MNDRQRIERWVKNYFAKNDIYPTANEVARYCQIPVGRIRQVVDGSDTMQMSWTGPKPPGVSSMIVEAIGDIE